MKPVRGRVMLTRKKAGARFLAPVRRPSPFAANDNNPGWQHRLVYGIKCVFLTLYLGFTLSYFLGLPKNWSQSLLDYLPF